MFRTPSVTDNRAGTSVIVRILPEPDDVLDGDVGNRRDTPGDGVQLHDNRASGVDSDQESSPGPRGLRFDPVRVLLARRLLSTVVSDPLVDKAGVAVARPGLMCGRGSPSGQWVHRMIARLTVRLRRARIGSGLSHRSEEPLRRQSCWDAVHALCAAGEGQRLSGFAITASSCFARASCCSVSCHRLRPWCSTSEAAPAYAQPGSRPGLPRASRRPSGPQNSCQE
jgi:hypothetical protein